MLGGIPSSFGTKVAKEKTINGKTLYGYIAIETNFLVHISENNLGAQFSFYIFGKDGVKKIQIKAFYVNIKLLLSSAIGQCPFYGNMLPIVAQLHSFKKNGIPSVVKQRYALFGHKLPLFIGNFHKRGLQDQGGFFGLKVHIAFQKYFIVLPILLEGIAKVDSPFVPSGIEVPLLRFKALEVLFEGANIELRQDIVVVLGLMAVYAGIELLKSKVSEAQTVYGRKGFEGKTHRITTSQQTSEAYGFREVKIFFYQAYQLVDMV